MSIAIKPNQSARVRALKAAQPGLGPRDLARITGADLSLVKAALEHGEKRKKVKSRAPLDAGRM